MSDRSNARATVPGGLDRPASTLELFFDLVYVFAITQVVGLLHDGATVGTLAKGALILWLLWWTWGTYTWTTNWTGTDGNAIRLFLLTTMGVTLLMSLTIPDAFGEGSQWFGVTYFTVRMLAAALYWYSSGTHPQQRAAFMSFFPFSSLAAGLILVGGFLDSPWLVIFWVGGGVLDLIAAANAGRETWSLDAHHFAERNGLFIIVALGETVVGIGLSAAGVDRDAVHIAAIIVGFAIACSLWWAYFHRAAPLIEEALAAAVGQVRSRIARDAYSLLHYPLVVGIVFYAVAVEEIVAHPDEPLDTFGRLALSLGVSLALLAIAASVYRVTRRIPSIRIGTAVLIMAIGAVAGSWNAVIFASAIAAVTVASLVWTQLRPWQDPIPDVQTPTPS
jgi:low temperature requirement protein LtrA